MAAWKWDAQLAVGLGIGRFSETARHLGIGTYDTPQGALQGRRQTSIWNASTPAVARAIAPTESTIVSDPRITNFDLAQEGFGQGFSGQMTPFQMALVAAAIGNMQGNLMRPRIEYNQPNAVFNQVTTPERAAEMRRIMGLVTMSGTARGAFASVNAAGIQTGGKTGTAERAVTRREVRQEFDAQGNLIRERVVTVATNQMRHPDSWFLCLAPLDNPQIAIAVMVEEAGFGSTIAAPIAAALVLKARELGLLGMPPASQQGNTLGNARRAER